MSQVCSWYKCDYVVENNGEFDPVHGLEQSLTCVNGSKSYKYSITVKDDIKNYWLHVAHPSALVFTILCDKEGKARINCLFNEFPVIVVAWYLVSGYY